MIKLTKNGIGLLTAQYRSVLRKCFFINLGVWTFGAATLVTPAEVYAGVLCNDGGAVTYESGTTCTIGTLIADLQDEPYIKINAAEGTTNYPSAAAQAYGYGDIAIGDSAVAGKSGQNYYATAVGYNSKATGQLSSAFGYNNTASGEASSAFGRSNTASRQDSSAVGYANKASELHSSAFGSLNTASGNYSSAFGYDNTASSYSSAIGYQNEARGAYSSAVGYQNTASGNQSSAFGYRSNAAGNYTTAIGYQAVANTAGSTTQGIISVGHKNGDPMGIAVPYGSYYSSDYFSRIINVADGTDAHDAATVGQVKGYFGDGLTYNSTTGKYDVTGGGSSYTAGTGISIDNDEIALDSDYMSNNYYTKSQADSAISTAVAGKANAADVYTKDEVYTKSEIDTTLTNYVTNDSLSTTLGDYAKIDDVYTKDETDSKISAAIAGKADAADVSALQGTISDLSDTLATKANQSDLEALQATVDTKANAADVYTKDEADNAISTAVATKAEQADLKALQTTVESKADTSTVTALQNDVADLNTAVDNKADASSVYTKTETDKEIAQSVSNAVGDRSNYSEQNYIHNDETVAQSLDYLDKAINQVSQNSAAIQAENRARFSNIEHRISKLENKMQKGLAANNALAALKPLSGDKYKTQLSISMGGYENNQAAAIGAFHYVTDRVVLNTGVAYGGNDSMSYNVGVTFGF